MYAMPSNYLALSPSSLICNRVNVNANVNVIPAALSLSHLDYMSYMPCPYMLSRLSHPGGGDVLAEDNHVHPPRGIVHALDGRAVIVDLHGRRQS